uniref:Uncharacterized protein n=1 Tax=Anopheles farauti TaxID=69004 RepID=A0A182QRB9_9DIPT
MKSRAVSRNVSRSCCCCQILKVVCPLIGCLLLRDLGENSLPPLGAILGLGLGEKKPHTLTEPSLTRLGRYGDSGPVGPPPNIARAPAVVVAFVTSSTPAVVILIAAVVSVWLLLVVVASATSATAADGATDTFNGVPSQEAMVEVVVVVAVMFAADICRALPPDRTSLCGRSTIGCAAVNSNFPEASTVKRQGKAFFIAP